MISNKIILQFLVILLLTLNLISSEELEIRKITSYEDGEIENFKSELGDIDNRWGWINDDSVKIGLYVYS